jgi:hypothetical protein
VETKSPSICGVLQLMSVEVPSAYGGSEASFMSLVLTIEELSKVEPSVGLLVNLQNTVVNTIIQVHSGTAISNRPPASHEFASFLSSSMPRRSRRRNTFLD